MSYRTPCTHMHKTVPRCPSACYRFLGADRVTTYEYMNVESLLSDNTQVRIQLHLDTASQQKKPSTKLYTIDESDRSKIAPKVNVNYTSFGTSVAHLHDRASIFHPFRIPFSASPTRMLMPSVSKTKSPSTRLRCKTLACWICFC